MKKFEVEYTYNIPEWGSELVTADTVEDAENLVLFDLSKIEDIRDIEVLGVREIGD